MRCVLLGFCLACWSCTGSGSDGEPAGTDAGPSDAAPDTTPDGGTASPYANIARVGVPSSFTPSGGGYALSSGKELFDVGQAFYAEHPDAFDMLIVWTDFVVADLFAFSVALRHDIDGIGLKEAMQKYGWSDLSPASAGSKGKLQHIVLMNGKQIYQSSAWPAEDILTHEVGHRWSANVLLPNATDPEVLVDTYWSHWSVYANVGGPSAEGYGTLLDEGGGSFSYELSSTLVYSRLELYQQGLLPSSEVGPMFYVEGANAFVPPTSASGPWTPNAYGEAVQFQGKRVSFTIDDVIAAYGPRSPAFPAQSSYKMAFILVCEEPGSCSEQSLQFVEAVRVGWPDAFAKATGGRATVSTTLGKE